MEEKQFKIKTDKKIDKDHDIKWTMKMDGKNEWFGFTTEYIRSKSCNKGYQSFTEHEGFFHQAGVLTFLKTSTQLRVWFDDVLEVTWVFKDDSAAKICSMRGKLTGIKFETDKEKDKVSTHFGYEPGTAVRIINNYYHSS